MGPRRVSVIERADDLPEGHMVSADIEVDPGLAGGGLSFDDAAASYDLHEDDCRRQREVVAALRKALAVEVGA